MFILRESCCNLLEISTGEGIVQQRAPRSAAEWFRQLMMPDRSNNLTLLIVSHGPVANGIPAIRGLWWSSSLCTPALPFYIHSLSIWHTLCQQQLIMCLTSLVKKKKKILNYSIRDIIWLIVRKVKGFDMSEFFFSLKIVSSLRILLCGMLQRIAVHYTFPTMTGD